MRLRSSEESWVKFLQTGSPRAFIFSLEDAVCKDSYNRLECRG